MVDYEKPPTDLIVGEMYVVPWSTLPHKFEGYERRHCQMHGDFVGWNALFRKRPNGSLSVADSNPSQFECINTEEQSGNE